jgi:hypothetical protein
MFTWLNKDDRYRCKLKIHGSSCSCYGRLILVVTSCCHISGHYIFCGRASLGWSSEKVLRLHREAEWNVVTQTPRKSERKQPDCGTGD